MTTTLPKIGAIFSLLLLVIYIFAVIFTMLFKELDNLDETSNYFSRLDFTFFSLIQFMTMDWVGSCMEVEQEYSWAPVLYVVYLSISGFIVLNLIVAVMCDALSMWGEKEEEEEEQRENRQRMEQIQKLKLEVDRLKQQALETDLVMDGMMREIKRLNGGTSRRKECETSSSRSGSSVQMKSKTLLSGKLDLYGR